MAKPPSKKRKETVTRAGFGETGEQPPRTGMKRSHKIALGATGIILAGAWLGSGSSERVSGPEETGADAKIYASLDECLAANRGFMTPKIVNGQLVDEKSPEQLKCEQDFKVAQADYEKTAPKFTKQNECEGQYGAGQCRQTTFNGASVFIPAMVGFMVANYLSNNRTPQALLPARQAGAGAVPCPPGITPVQQPGCLMPRTSSNSSSTSSGWRSYSTSSGYTVSRDTTKPANSPTKVPSAAAAAPAARSNFGAAPTHPVSSISRSATTTSRGGFGSTSHSISRSSSS